MYQFIIPIDKTKTLADYMLILDATRKALDSVGMDWFEWDPSELFRGCLENKFLDFHEELNALYHSLIGYTTPDIDFNDLEQVRQYLDSPESKPTPDIFDVIHQGVLWYCSVQDAEDVYLDDFSKYDVVIETENKDLAMLFKLKGYIVPPTFTMSHEDYYSYLN